MYVITKQIGDKMRNFDEQDSYQIDEEYKKLKKAYFGKLSPQNEINIAIGIICSMIGIALASILPLIFIFI